MISANSLTKKFGKFTAVNGLSFEIEKGKIVGFLGSNAAGKTTTMRMLTCYFPPTSGSATVAGHDIFTESLKVRQKVGYLPENVPLYRDMPVEYFLEFVGSLKGVPGKEIDSRVEKALSMCNLLDVRKKEIGQLSKGYRQRVGIAQSIINNPPVLILDEPTVGLDPKQIIEIRKLILGFRDTSTIILSTHILHEIEKVCDKILIIDRGELLAYDTLGNLEARLAGRALNILAEGRKEQVEQALKQVKSLDNYNFVEELKGNLVRYVLSIEEDSTSIRREIMKTMKENDLVVLEIDRINLSAEDIFRKIVPDKTTEIVEEEQAETEETEENSGKTPGKEKTGK
ncbi:MAG: ABC transporter ATP-binding protein [Vulcanimicrobiota bacterium]